MENRKIRHLKEEKMVYVTDTIIKAEPTVINIPEGKVRKKQKKIMKVSYLDTSSEEVLNTYMGNISHYGADCSGCTGRTASGYNVGSNFYYEDSKYGTVRIVAADSQLPFGTIVRINNNSTTMLAIVLDRGGAIGFEKKYMLDLLCESEDSAIKYGTLNNSTIEILRYGY